MLIIVGLHILSQKKNTYLNLIIHSFKYSPTFEYEENRWIHQPLIYQQL